jgi:enolase
MSTAVGDEGGFAPSVANHEAAIQLILEAIDKAGYQAGSQIALGLDCAASEFHKDGKYVLGGEGLSLGGRLHRTCVDLVRQVPDHLDRGRHGRERLGRLAHLTAGAGRRCSWWATIFSSPTRASCARASSKGIANSILIKINQIGTLTETFAAIEMAKRNGYTAVVSHRSGETEDTTIADIAVGTNALQIKTGSMSRSDRIAKYNQLLRIEEDLGDVASTRAARRVLQPALTVDIVIDATGIPRPASRTCSRAASTASTS